MNIRTFAKADWRRFSGCERAIDGREPMINILCCVLTDFPAKYVETVTSPNWDKDGTVKADWQKWLEMPEIAVVVDKTGVSICCGPDDGEWLQLECSYDLGLAIAQSLGDKLSLAALLEMGFIPYNWNSNTVGAEAEVAWLKDLVTKKEVIISLSVAVLRTIVLANIHPDADPTEVAATGLRSVLGHHNYEVYGDIEAFEI